MAMIQIIVSDKIGETVFASECQINMEAYLSYYTEEMQGKELREHVRHAHEAVKQKMNTPQSPDAS